MADITVIPWRTNGGQEASRQTARKIRGDKGFSVHNPVKNETYVIMGQDAYDKSKELADTVHEVQQGEQSLSGRGYPSQGKLDALSNASAKLVQMLMGSKSFTPPPVIAPPVEKPKGLLDIEV